MGMFDKPQFLTGNDGFAKEGDVFWLHNARLDGTDNRGNEKAKLLVSGDRDADKSVVYTSGKGIVGQISRMDESDLARMPIEVRLDGRDVGKGNRVHILNPASAPVPTDATTDDSPF